jgi:hypothetical protein
MERGSKGRRGEEKEREDGRSSRTDSKLLRFFFGVGKHRSEFVSSSSWY